MRVTRRNFIKSAGATGLALAAASGTASAGLLGGIDRHAVVRRHNPTVTAFDPFSALTVGNGEFAFTADVTGLQTFAPECEKAFPLCTTAHWSWHTIPLPAGLRVEDFKYQNFDTYGRPVGYPTDRTGQEELFDWMRQNPHRLHLGRIALILRKSDGSPAAPDDLRNCRQVLDLWSDGLDSRFDLEGQPVHVQTCCHPDMDVIAARIESPLIAKGQLQVLFAFPYGSPEMPMADWTKQDRHATELIQRTERRADFKRQLDAENYFVSIEWPSGFVLNGGDAHRFQLVQVASASWTKELEFSCAFAQRPISGSLPGFSRTQSAAAAHWRDFWEEGGAADFGECADPRAPELERRTVLSLYNTAVHCAGSLPSAETGLLFNSWYGKFHLEMHWWHSVHFTAWNRFSRFEKSLSLYERILPLARETAKRQGYRGARWPKMIGPDGHESASNIGPLLIWQQPHPIYYAELCYRNQPSKPVLDRWRGIVFDTAEFMASFAVLVSARNQFVLGPPLKTVPENTDTATTVNPTFELAYWRFGLGLAQTWRERCGLGRSSDWDRVLNSLAPLPQQDGLYLMQEGQTDTYTRWNWEHPSLVGALGMLPGNGVEPDTMRRSVARIIEVWQWDRAWGWDFGNTAMCAARTGQPDLAVNALLVNSVKNRIHPNGHNFQRDDLPAYLPGNGALLCAVAMMCAGWAGAPKKSAPGFPADGKWAVRHSDLKTWV